MKDVSCEKESKQDTSSLYLMAVRDSSSNMADQSQEGRPTGAGRKTH